MWRTEENIDYLFTVFLCIFGSYLHLEVPLAEHVDNLIEHDGNVFWEVALSPSVSLASDSGVQLIKDVAIDLGKERISLDLLLLGDSKAIQPVCVLQYVVDQPSDG